MCRWGSGAWIISGGDGRGWWEMVRDRGADAFPFNNHSCTSVDDLTLPDFHTHKSSYPHTSSRSPTHSCHFPTFFLPFPSLS